MCTLYLWILTSKFVYWSFNYLKYNLQHITTSKWCLDMIYSFWRLEKLMKCRSKYFHLFIQFSPSVVSDSWTAALQASLTITNSYILFKLMSIALVKPSNQLILCCPLLPMPSIFPSIRVFSNWVGSSHQVAKVLEFQLQHQSFQWIFRTDFL